MSPQPCRVAVAVPQTLLHRVLIESEREREVGWEKDRGRWGGRERDRERERKRQRQADNQTQKDRQRFNFHGTNHLVNFQETYFCRDTNLQVTINRCSIFFKRCCMSPLSAAWPGFYEYAYIVTLSLSLSLSLFAFVCSFRLFYVIASSFPVSAPLASRQSECSQAGKRVLPARVPFSSTPSPDGTEVLGGELG